MLKNLQQMLDEMGLPMSDLSLEKAGLVGRLGFLLPTPTPM